MNDKKRRKRKRARLVKDASAAAQKSTDKKTSLQRSENYKTEDEAEFFVPSAILQELPGERIEAPKETKNPEKRSRINRSKARRSFYSASTDKTVSVSKKSENRASEYEAEYFALPTIIHEIPEEKSEPAKEVKNTKSQNRGKKAKAKDNTSDKQKTQCKHNNAVLPASSLSTAERALNSYKPDEADDSVEDSSSEAFYAARVIAEDAVHDVSVSVQVVAEKVKYSEKYSEKSSVAAQAKTDQTSTVHTTTEYEQDLSTAKPSSESIEEHKARQKQYQKKRNKRRQIAENFGRKNSEDSPETVGFAAYIREKIFQADKDEKPKGRIKTVAAIILLIALAAVLIMALVSSVSMLIEVITSYLAISTYPSDDSDMLAAEAQYCAMEEQLNRKINDYVLDETYDEYEFELDDIGHDPYVLISCITAKVGGEWYIGDVQDIIQDLFDRQYELKEEVETVGDSTVCTVTLTNNNLARIPGEILDEEQLSRYAIYMAVLGNRPDLFPNSDYIGKYINGEYEVYEIPPEALEDEKFAAMIEEAEKYLGYPYVWGGSSPSTSFDCSGYICWILNHSGWSVGRTTAQGLFNSCTPVSRGNAKPGDLVFFTGTYKTEDKCSHVGLYVGDNMMIHCGDPITYTSIATDYWQSHFYAFARLP